MNEASTSPEMFPGGANDPVIQGEEAIPPDQDAGSDVEVSEKVSDSFEEQLLYAKILEVGMFLGLGLLLIAFALYVLRILPPVIPIEQLSDYWTMSVDDYLGALNEQLLHREHLLTGWSWLSQIGKGDYLNFIPIAILSAITIVCYAGITPVLIRKKDRAYVIMAVVEILVLTLAASGLLTVGH
ncbi:hypothetical protein ACFL3H_05010 [Gemmatimonadota bacterium]